MSKKKATTEESFTEEYVVLAISNWLEAIDEFLQWQDKLNKAINAYDSQDYRLINIGFNNPIRWSADDLVRLHLDLANELRKLLKKVNFIEDGLSSLAKIQELNSHTKTIHSWSKKIQNALFSISSGTA